MCQKIAIFASGTSDSTIVLKRLLTYIVIALSYLSMGAIGYVPQLDVYGRVMESRGDLSLVPFRYQGQYEDSETGLYYNRFRYYDPKTGAYISQDPIGLAGGILNLYGYVIVTNAWIDVLGYAGYKFTKKSKHHIHERHIKKSGYSPTKKNLVNKSKFKNPKRAIKDAGKVIDNPDKVTLQGNRTLYQKIGLVKWD